MILLGRFFSFFFAFAAIFQAGCSSIPPILPHTPPARSQTAPAESLPHTPSATASSTPIRTAEPVSRLDIQAGDLRGEILHFWHPWIGPAGEAISALVEEFNLDNPWGVLVVPVPHPGYDALDAALQAGPSEFPEVVVGFQHQALGWDRANALVDLQLYLNDPEWGLSPAEQAELYSVFWDPEVVDGRRLGLPAFRSASLLLYNQTWARELGFQAPPAAPEQFRQQACAAARSMRSDGDPSNDGTGGYIISTDYPALLSWIYAFGGDPLKSPEPGAGRSVYLFDTPEIAETLTFLRELYDLGCAWESQSQTPDPAFAGRRGLFASASLLDLPDILEAFKRSGNKDEWTVIPYPSPSGAPALDSYGPSYFLLPASPEQQLASWLLLRWLSMPVNHARMVAAVGAFPVRGDALDDLEGYAKTRPQWRGALELIDYARPEPAYASWRRVRFALGDAATQLYRSYFSLDQIPLMLAYLDGFAAELHLGSDPQDLFGTSTYTPTPTFTPTRTLTPTPSPTLTRTSRPTSTPTAAR